MLCLNRSLKICIASILVAFWSVRAVFAVEQIVEVPIIFHGVESSDLILEINDKLVFRGPSITPWGEPYIHVSVMLNARLNLGENSYRIVDDGYVTKGIFVIPHKVDHVSMRGATYVPRPGNPTVVYYLEVSFFPPAYD